MDIGLCVTGARFIDNNQAVIVRNSIKNLIEDIKSATKFDNIQFHVGDAMGVDTIARRYVKFYAQNNNWMVVTDHVVKDRNNKASYAQRSMGMVNHCHQVNSEKDNTIIIGFPNKPCPKEVTPHNPFCGSGSGTWATLAYAKSKGMIIEIVPLIQKIPAPHWLLS